MIVSVTAWGCEIMITCDPSTSAIWALARLAMESTTSAPAALSPVATTAQAGRFFHAAGPFFSPKAAAATGRWAAHNMAASLPERSPAKALRNDAASMDNSTAAGRWQLAVVRSRRSSRSRQRRRRERGRRSRGPLAEFASVMVVPFSGGQVAPSRVPAGLHTRPASSGSGLDEVEQVGVEGVLVGGGVSEAVRGPGVDLQGRVLDDLRRQEGRGTDGHDLVVVAVDDQGRDVDLLEVFGEVGLGEGLDAVVRALHADAHAHQPERVAQALGHGVAGPVGAVEGRAEVLVELGPVGGEAGAEAVEHLDRQAAGVSAGLQHQRRDRAQEHGPGDAGGAVAADVAGYLPATCGVPDQDGVAQVECLDQLGEVISVGVQVVPVPGLAGTPAAATVMSDGAIAV